MLDVFKNCTNLSTIYTPYNLKLSVTLPIDSSTDRWYCSDGTAVTELPKNLPYSVELGKIMSLRRKNLSMSLQYILTRRAAKHLLP